MSILKRLRDALRLRSRHDEPTSEFQYPFPSWRFGRLFRSKSRSKQCSTGYGTNERKRSYLAEDKESPPIIPPFTFDAQSTFWPSLLDVTSATLAPAQIIGHTQEDEITNVPTTGTTVSPHPRTTAVPPLRPRSTFCTSLLDVTADCFAPAGSISLIFNTENWNPSNVPVAGTTASPQLVQLTTEYRLSPPNTRPFRLLNLPAVSLDDLSSAEFIAHASDNGDHDVPTVTLSPNASLLDVSSSSLPPAESVGYILDAEDANATNVSVTGTAASPQLAQLTTEPPAEFIGHAPDNEDGNAKSAPTAEATVSLQTGSYVGYIHKLNVTDKHPARILKLPIEILCEIMAFLLFAEPIYAPTHIRLLAPRHVCQHLREIAKKEIRKTLNASRRHFDTERSSELREWFKGHAKSQDLKHEVSLQVDLDTRYSLDKDLLKNFVGALPNCRQARVEIQGIGGLFGKPFGTLPITTVPPSDIHSFSWISATLGIRDPIPLNGFPWHVLVNDLPWSQLTYLSLDCPLSDVDAYGVLSKGQTTFQSVSLKLTKIDQNISSDPVALPRLRSLTIDTHVPVRDLLSKLSLSALENLDLKSRVCAREESPLLNQHLNVPWGQLKSLSLSNEDTGERRRCPVTAILMECSQLQRFEWDGSSDAFETWTSAISFMMSQQLEELIVKSDPQGCKLLLEKLSYKGNVIRRVNISHLDLDNSPYTRASLPRWTHITVSEGVTLFDLSEILINGRGLIKASCLIIEGGAPLTSKISSVVQELELCTNIRTPSLWKWLDSIRIQSVKISFGKVEFNCSQVLDDMAPFLQRYPNLPSPLISPTYTQLKFT